ncbi:hypothetical protein ACQR1I_03085 [Bradyrhizobium sp. HKCCYLS2038]
MDIFARNAVAVAAVVPGLGYAADRTTRLAGLADHRITYYPQGARRARWRAVPHCIDNDMICRYVVTRRDKKAA